MRNRCKRGTETGLHPFWVPLRIRGGRYPGIGGSALGVPLGIPLASCKPRAATPCYRCNPTMPTEHGGTPQFGTALAPLHPACQRPCARRNPALFSPRCDTAPHPAGTALAFPRAPAPRRHTRQRPGLKWHGPCRTANNMPEGPAPRATLVCAPNTPRGLTPAPCRGKMGADRGR